MNFTGIGSRNTPDDVLLQMTEISTLLTEHGHILRSGHADGADRAFEEGVLDNNADIFLPWRTFNDHFRPLRDKCYIDCSKDKKHSVAMKTAELMHPNWQACSNGARLLHSRNIYQVLGPVLFTPSDILICWTPGGERVGGTATAIRLAESLKIEVINLGSEDAQPSEILERLTL